MFKNFQKFIIEGLKNPLLINWNKSQSEWIGVFKIDDIKYDIAITNYSTLQNHWLFKFKANGEFKLLNDPKKAFLSIPTIDSAAIQFIEEIQPESFIFCALDESKTRRLFYDRFCYKIVKKYRSSLKYTHKPLQFFNLDFYILKSKECDLTELDNNITKIAKDFNF